MRRFVPSDAARVHEIQSDWDVARMLRMASYPPGRAGLEAWLEEHEAEWLAGTAYRFGLVLDGRIIGCADVDEIRDGAGELGYWLDRAWWGQGLAGEAAAAVREFALGALGLRRLLSGHAVDNPASGRILIRLGFEVAGEEPQWYRSRQAEVAHRRYVLDAPSLTT